MALDSVVALYDSFETNILFVCVHIMTYILHIPPPHPPLLAQLSGSNTQCHFFQRIFCITDCTETNCTCTFVIINNHADFMHPTATG